MSWANAKKTGSGALDFRLCIAGWPHEWTTSLRITHASAADGRLVFPTLSYDGLIISERLSLRQAWPEVQPITVTVKASIPTEETVNGFTRDVEPLGVLSVAMDAEGFADVATLDNSLQLAAGVYHIGTEALRSAGGNSLQRAIWNTVAEAHPVTTFSGRLLLPAVYNWPPTMDGRRAYLYAYGEADDGAGEGTCIWRGIVVEPPSMQRDGVTWTIGCDPITTVFEQEVAANDELFYRIRGIYHSHQCPLAMAFRAAYDDDSHQVGTDGPDIVRYVTGFHETQEDFTKEVNAKLTDMIAARTALYGVTELRSATYEEKSKAPTVTLSFVDAASLDVKFDIAWFPMQGVLEGAMIEGVTPQTLTGRRTSKLGAKELLGNLSTIPGPIIDEFGPTLENVPQDENPPWGFPLPRARAMLGSPPQFAGSFNNLSIAATDQSTGIMQTWPANRLYLERVDGLKVGDYLYAKTGDSAIPIIVTGVFQQAQISGQAGNYITVELKQLPKSGGPLYLDSSTVLVPLRVFAAGANISDFVAGAVAQGVNANDGDTPFVTNNDVNPASLAALFQDGSGIDSYWYHRMYAYVKPVTLKNIITPELKLTGLMARLEVDGRLGFAKLPQFTAGTTAAGALTDADILPPARGMVGMFPAWESQPEGLVNIVDIKVGYGPAQDDYDENYTYHIKLNDSVALHKSSGRGSETIEVKSMAASAVPSSILPNDIILFGQVPGDVDGEKAARWAKRYLSILSIEYALVTVAVPITFFDYRVGDVLDVTCAYIPNGQGGRGVIARKACILRRLWNLDPGNRSQMGQLTLYFPRYLPAGYTPTGLVFSFTNLGGNNWRLFFNSGDPMNRAWSELDDGYILRHFAVGDAIRVIEYGVTTPVVVTGTITAIDPATPYPSTCVVAMDSALPTTGQRVMMWRSQQSPLTARQKTYCYVASANRNLSTGYARTYL